MYANNGVQLWCASGHNGRRFDVILSVSAQPDWHSRSPCRVKRNVAYFQAPLINKTAVCSYYLNYIYFLMIITWFISMHSVLGMDSMHSLYGYSVLGFSISYIIVINISIMYIRPCGAAEKC